MAGSAWNGGWRWWLQLGCGVAAILEGLGLIAIVLGLGGIW